MKDQKRKRSKSGLNRRPCGICYLTVFAITATRSNQLSYSTRLQLSLQAALIASFAIYSTRLQLSLQAGLKKLVFLFFLLFLVIVFCFNYLSFSFCF